ncbi:MAG: T9SS type A sorting domain-containing protein [Candidatus Riflebacteria bacterium]|nr:T9SS type A sorting domain-containing protein [Candidatus Riflebacteria bacterium]
MKEKYGMFKFVFASMICCLLATAVITGCGGGNNPAGPSTAVVATNPVTNSLAPGQFNLIGKVVVDGSNPIGSISVKLFVQDSTTGSIVDSGRANTTLTSGEFNFNNLSTGTYILKIEESDKYLESSKLAIISGGAQVTVDSGSLNLFAKSTLDPAVPTIDLRARITSSLSQTGASVADITLDSGQRTVSDGFGIFTLKNIERGTRRMTIEQPGFSPYTISFVVEGDTPPNAEQILINNTAYPVNSGARTVDLVIYAYDIQVNPNLHTSGALMGTVKKYIIVNGAITPNLEAMGNYEFALWQVFPNNTARSFGSVMSKADGTWRVDQLPPFEDNGAAWFAVPVNTIVQIIQADSGNVIVFSSTDPVWIGREAVLAYGYKVAAGQTTIMDFTVPTFATAPTANTVAVITDAKLATDGVTFNFDVEAALLADLYARWTGPGTSTVATLEFNRAYTGATTQTISKSFNLTDTSATFVHNFNFKPSDLGLDYGRYTWKILANDPAQPNKPTFSASKLITIRPSNTEVTPREGTTIAINADAAYVYSFTVPVDPDAKTYAFELYTAGNVLVASKIGTGPNFETPLAGIAAGNYHWQVTYSYNDGPPMRSEVTNITFQ